MLLPTSYFSSANSDHSFLPLITYHFLLVALVACVALISRVALVARVDSCGSCGSCGLSQNGYGADDSFAGDVNHGDGDVISFVDHRACFGQLLWYYSGHSGTSRYSVHRTSNNIFYFKLGSGFPISYSRVLFNFLCYVCFVSF